VESAIAEPLKIGASTPYTGADAKVTFVVAASPVPLRLRVWGLSAAPSVNVILPNRAPVADGEKVTESVQVATAA
jgi:hypothetical protein